MTPGRPGFSRVAQALTLVVILIAALAGCGGTTASDGGASPTATTIPPATPPPTATPAAATVRYVALGASDAVGVGASDPNHTAYIPIIISRLPSGASALNLGVSGETLHGALTSELPQAIAAQPTLITVWLVGNDFKNCVPLAKYTADLNTLLTQLQTKTHAKVFVANAPNFSALPAIQQAIAGGAFCNGASSLAGVRALTAQWNTAIATSVAAHHDTLVDLSSGDISVHPNDISSDGFHPSDAGYLALANAFWAAITAHHAV